MQSYEIFSFFPSWITILSISKLTKIVFLVVGQCQCRCGYSLNLQKIFYNSI